MSLRRGSGGLARQVATVSSRPAMPLSAHLAYRLSQPIQACAIVISMISPAAHEMRNLGGAQFARAMLRLPRPGRVRVDGWAIPEPIHIPTPAPAYFGALPVRNMVPIGLVVAKLAQMGFELGPDVLE
jgi:hypothetical protein